MAAPRYVVPGVPRGVQASAFMPHWNKYAASGAQQYKRFLVGQPGTQGIPVTDPQQASTLDGFTMSQMGTARSANAPNVFYPQLYYQPNLYAAPGPVTPVRIYSDNLMPVPAVDPRGVPARLARPISQRGKWEIPQPRALPVWGSG